MFPAFVSAQDLDLDPEKTNRHIGFGEARKTDGIFFSRHNHLDIAPDTAVDEAVELRLGVAVMIGVALRQFDPRTQFPQTVLETFRRGDAANGADVGVAEALERKLLAGDHVLKMERLVGALDDLRRAIVSANSFDQFVVRLARALGDEDVAGPPQIPGRLAESAPRQKMLISKRRLPIDQNDIKPVFEMQILESVVQQKGIGLQLLDREQAA